jgi:hypothetical protein
VRRRTADVIRLRGVVDSPAYFAVSGSDPVTFDLTQATFIAWHCADGLRRAAQACPVQVILSEGPVRDVLHRWFSGQLAPTVGAGCYRVTL